MPSRRTRKAVAASEKAKKGPKTRRFLKDGDTTLRRAKIMRRTSGTSPLGLKKKEWRE
jgi:hypothetical protein